MTSGAFGEFQLGAPLESDVDRVERWSAEADDGRRAEILTGEAGLVERVSGLARGAAFVSAQVTATTAGARVLVPSELKIQFSRLPGLVQPVEAFAMVMLVSEALVPVHDAERAYGVLHPEGVGFDSDGHLRIAPVLHRLPLLEPHGTATTEATDCRAVGALLLHLLGGSWPPPNFPDPVDIAGLDVTRANLVVQGLLRRRPRLRITPARAVAQTLSAIFKASNVDPDAILATALTRLGVGTALRRDGDVRWEVLGESTSDAMVRPAARSAAASIMVEPEPVDNEPSVIPAAPDEDELDEPSAIPAAPDEDDLDDPSPVPTDDEDELEDPSPISDAPGLEELDAPSAPPESAAADPADAPDAGESDSDFLKVELPPMPVEEDVEDSPSADQLLAALPVDDPDEAHVARVIMSEEVSTPLLPRVPHVPSVDDYDAPSLDQTMDTRDYDLPSMDQTIGVPGHEDEIRDAVDAAFAEAEAEEADEADAPADRPDTLGESMDQPAFLGESIDEPESAPGPNTWSTYRADEEETVFGASPTDEDVQDDNTDFSAASQLLAVMREEATKDGPSSDVFVDEVGGDPSSFAAEMPEFLDDDDSELWDVTEHTNIGADHGPTTDDLDPDDEDADSLDTAIPDAPEPVEDEDSWGNDFSEDVLTKVEPLQPAMTASFRPAEPLSEDSEDDYEELSEGDDDDFSESEDDELSDDGDPLSDGAGAAEDQADELADSGDDELSDSGDEPPEDDKAAANLRLATALFTNLEDSMDGVDPAPELPPVTLNPQPPQPAPIPELTPVSVDFEEMEPEPLAPEAMEILSVEPSDLKPLPPRAPNTYETRREQTLSSALGEDAPQSSMPASFDRDVPGRALLGRTEPGDNSGWMSGSVGVTENSDREAELGAGKWTQQGRSMEEIARDMPQTPVREMEIESSGPSMLPIVAVVVLVAAVAIWFVFFRGEPVAEAPLAPTPIEQPAAGAGATSGATGPSVTITTDPAGARVTFDGADYGKAPTTVPMPEHGDHELCIFKGSVSSCRTLTPQQLTDPYHFDAD